MKKFTEGPWVWDMNRPDALCPALFGKDKKKVIDLGDEEQYYPGSGYVENDADYSLIASSPSMYKALERILNKCNLYLDIEVAMPQDAMAKIALICTKELKKARGE